MMNRPALSAGATLALVSLYRETLDYSTTFEGAANARAAHYLYGGGAHGEPLGLELDAAFAPAVDGYSVSVAVWVDGSRVGVAYGWDESSTVDEMVESAETLRTSLRALSRAEELLEQEREDRFLEGREELYGEPGTSEAPSWAEITREMVEPFEELASLEEPRGSYVVVEELADGETLEHGSAVSLTLARAIRECFESLTGRLARLEWRSGGSLSWH